MLTTLTNYNSDNVYKKQKSFEDRSNESKNIRTKYTDRVPVVFVRCGGDTPELDKFKFITPGNLSVGQVKYVVMRRLRMRSTDTLFLFVDGGRTMCNTDSISTVYEEFCDKDGFLYIYYSLENVFG